MELTQEQELEQIPDRPSKLFWIHIKCLVNEETVKLSVIMIMMIDSTARCPPSKYLALWNVSTEIF